MEILAFGDRALLIRALDQPEARALAEALLPRLGQDGLEDVVPGDGSILIRFEATSSASAAARAVVAEAAGGLAAQPGAGPGATRTVRIPVRYGGVDGPDLAEASRAVGLTEAEVVARHTASTHVVAFLGFAPGFPYLTGLDPALAVPRLAVPRTVTPAGSVAIAEGYTGIYPADLPGGWRIIGRTSMPMFDPTADPPTTLRPGDAVRFEAVDA